MRCCCVVNCTKRSENGWRMFNIPRGRHPFAQNRRRLWLQAIKRLDWSLSGPKTGMSICGAHFISGEPSMDCDSPDFVPSLFPQRAIYVRKRRKDKASATTATLHADAEPESGGLSLTSKERPKPQKRPFKNKVVTNSKVQEKNGGKTVSKKARIQSGTSIQNKCCVLNCPSQSHNNRGQRIRNNLSFYSFPTWTQNCGVFVSHLSKRRREAWVTAVGRPDITFDVSEEVKVCSRHFVTGEPALGMVQMDLDWVPTLHLNNEAEIVRSPDKKKQPMKKGKNIVKTPVKRKWKEAVKDTAEPIPLQWKELKSCLQVLMTDKNDPKEVTPAVDNSALSFEEYFRNALTASLDSCQTSQQKRPSCGNCVRLEGRISELEERLATPHQILGQNIWPQWTEPLSQSTGEPSSPCKEDKKIPPQTNTFMVNLIKRHWFLRFSPSSNTIWCHVCRLYAGKGCRNSKFVTGTRSFQNSAIALHTRNRNHKECVKKFMALKNAKKTVGRFRR